MKPPKYDQNSVTHAFHKRGKHLAAYLPLYDRVVGILFGSIIDRRTDVEARVFRIRYQPRPRVMQIGIGWKREDDSYPRSTGFFSLFRDGIFSVHDIQTWPKRVVAPGWRSIADMHDDDIVERILTLIGAPWAHHYPVPEGTGALRHDAKRLLFDARMLRAVAPPHHQREVDDILRRISEFNAVIGT